MSGKWTPGPWEVGPLDGKYYGTIVYLGDRTGVRVWDHGMSFEPSVRQLAEYGITDWRAATREERYDVTCDTHYETAQDLADAHLVAAAPTLAEALEAAVDVMDAALVWHTHVLSEAIKVDFAAALSEARAALAKARGEQ